MGREATAYARPAWAAVEGDHIDLPSGTIITIT